MEAGQSISHFQQVKGTPLRSKRLETWNMRSAGAHKTESFATDNQEIYSEINWKCVCNF
jgi:hypothetical protein